LPALLLKLEVIGRKSMWTFFALFETKTPSLSGPDGRPDLSEPTRLVPKNIELAAAFSYGGVFSRGLSEGQFTACDYGSSAL
jgi:hypothetical protein